jgi:Plasma-membrane choline transporter
MHLLFYFFASLRLFSLIPLAFAFLTARRLVNLPRDIYTTSTLLTLTTHLLASHPFLLALSPGILLIALLASIPFMTLAFRLLLIGYSLSPSSGWEWHVKGWANWAILATIAIWLWSWGVARGVLRTTTAAVVASWYFAEYVLLVYRSLSHR